MHIAIIDIKFMNQLSKTFYLRDAFRQVSFPNSCDYPSCNGLDLSLFLHRETLISAFNNLELVKLMIFTSLVPKDSRLNIGNSFHSDL
jgi:hypothetical protein